MVDPGVWQPVWGRRSEGDPDVILTSRYRVCAPAFAACRLVRGFQSGMRRGIPAAGGTSLAGRVLDYSSAFHRLPAGARLDEVLLDRRVFLRVRVSNLDRGASAGHDLSPPGQGGAPLDQHGKHQRGVYVHCVVRAAGLKCSPDFLPFQFCKYVVTSMKSATLKGYSSKL
jgi:hypothetical protein